MADTPSATCNRSLQPANARTHCATDRQEVSCCFLPPKRIDTGSMITMPLQGSDIPHPQRRRAKRSAVAGRASRHGLTRRPAAPTAATRLPQRPDPSILSEAIPLFFIGQNKAGFWVARDAGGGNGGIFLLKHSALQFANTNTLPWGCATMFVEERFELDIENKGNPLVAHLGAARRLVSRLAKRLTASAGKMAAAGRMTIARFSRALAEKRIHRAAIERELFRGRYKHASKNDDDLPIVR